MKNSEKHVKQFPDGMKPLGKSIFKFSCHPKVRCFNSCCRKLDMYLYPYDVVQLKKHLSISSEEFLRLYTRIGKSTHPYFPAVMMKMTDDEEQTCPFLGSDGCTVYENRPSACRSYPLERAVDRSVVGGRPQEYYFLTKHPYCFGHFEDAEWTVDKWLRDQKILNYNLLNDMWAEVDTMFSTNPWQGEGAAGPRQQLAFMACYNIDGFREFVNDNKLLSQYKLDKNRVKFIKQDDEALLKFGFDWLKKMLAGFPTLQPRR